MTSFEHLDQKSHVGSHMCLLLEKEYDQPNEESTHKQQTAQNTDILSACSGATATALQPYSATLEETEIGIDTDVHQEVPATKGEGYNLV